MTRRNGRLTTTDRLTEEEIGHLPTETKDRLDMALVLSVQRDIVEALGDIVEVLDNMSGTLQLIANKPASILTTDNYQLEMKAERLVNLLEQRWMNDPT